MSDYHCQCYSRNCPGSDRFSPSRITSSFVIAMLIFVLLFIPAAAAAPDSNRDNPRNGAQYEHRLDYEYDWHRFCVRGIGDADTGQCYPGSPGKHTKWQWWGAPE